MQTKKVVINKPVETTAGLAQSKIEDKITPLKKNLENPQIPLIKQAMNGMGSSLNKVNNLTDGDTGIQQVEKIYIPPEK